MGIAKTQFQVDEYTRLVEEETLIGKRTVFFATELKSLDSLLQEVSDIGPCLPVPCGPN